MNAPVSPSWHDAKLSGWRLALSWGGVIGLPWLAAVLCWWAL